MRRKRSAGISPGRVRRTHRNRGYGLGPASSAAVLAERQAPPGPGQGTQVPYYDDPMSKLAYNGVSRTAILLTFASIPPSLSLT